MQAWFGFNKLKIRLCFCFRITLVVQIGFSLDIEIPLNSGINLFFPSFSENLRFETEGLL